MNGQSLRSPFKRNDKRILVCGNDEGIGGAQVAFRRFVAFLQQEPHVEAAAIAIGRSIEGGLAQRSEPVMSCISLGGSVPIKLADSLAAAIRARVFAPDVFVAIGLARSALLISRLLPGSTRRMAFDFIADRELDCPLLRASRKRFDQIVVQSPAMEARLLESGLPREKVASLPCFPGTEYSDLAKNGLGHIGPVLRLAYFGRLAHNKGLPDYCAALARLGSVPFTTLDIWGSGPAHDQIVAAIKEHGLADRVAIKGRYPDGYEGAALMARYDAIVVPSQRLEGVPLVLIEAMSVGMPALCTDVGAIRDACIGNPDFVISRSDRDGLVRGTQELHRRLAAGEIDHDRLRAYYLRHYSFEAVAARWREQLGLSSSLIQAA